MFRLFSVEPKGDKCDVLVKYYDTQTQILHEKKDSWKHIIFSREILPEKHGLTSGKTLEELNKLYPGHSFMIKGYSMRKKSDETLSIYTGGMESFVVWHLGERRDSKNLEFFLKKDKDQEYIDENLDYRKQIFFRNSDKRFLARSKIIPDIGTLMAGKEKILEESKKNQKIFGGIHPNDIRIKANSKNPNRNHLELICTKHVLNNLPTHYFKILEYESEEFNKENDAQEFMHKIKFQLKIPEGSDILEDFFDGFEDDLFPEYYKQALKKKLNNMPIMSANDISKSIDHLRIFYGHESDGKDTYSVRLEAINEPAVHEKLRALGFKKSIVEGKHKRTARQELWDPLMLDNPTKQLKYFFPSHMPYNPDKPLANQQRTDAITFRQSDDAWDIDATISDAMKFLEKNIAAFDIEIIDFIKNEPLTGRIYMAVLKSLSEKILFQTKTDSYKSQDTKKIIDTFKETKHIFSDDEIELRAQANQIAQKYVYLAGHNIDDFDREHLAKFNTDLELLKKGEIDDKTREKISAMRSKYKIDGKTPSRLWTHTTDDVLDTYKYAKSRINLFSDHKLATFGNFSKGESYDVLIQLIKEGTWEGLERVIKYTLIDGDESLKVVNNHLYYAVLESLATNKSLSSVFASDPRKNFYDAGQRRYMMVKGTHRDRHELSPRKHLKKFNDRSTPEDIFAQITDDIKTQNGIVEGTMYYPSAIIESFFDVIFREPIYNFIYAKAMQEQNKLHKTDLLWKVSSIIHVAVDKAKNYMLASGHEFGNKYELKDIYESLSKDESSSIKNGENKSVSESYFNSGDFELSRTGFIFGIEYGVDIDTITSNGLPYDNTILRINNSVSERLDVLRKTGVLAKSDSFVIINNDTKDDYAYNQGYSFGRVRAISLKNNRFIGRFLDESLPDIYQSIEKPKDPTILGLIDRALSKNLGKLEDELKIIYSMPYESQIDNKNRELIRTILGVDPKKSKGTLGLFD